MKKGLIILGKQGLLKSLSLTGITSSGDVDTVSLMDCGQLLRKEYSRNYLVSRLNSETKILIIDDVPCSFNWDYLLPLFNKFSIGNACNNVSEILLTKVIAVCNESVSLQDLPTGASFNRRFEIKQL